MSILSQFKFLRCVSLAAIVGLSACGGPSSPAANPTTNSTTGNSLASTPAESSRGNPPAVDSALPPAVNETPKPAPELDTLAQLSPPQGNPRPATSIDLAQIVPVNTSLFLAIPDLKQTYTRYQTTGIGRWIQTPEMKPFRDSLRPTGALGLANISGILGFDENLLAKFPKPACVLAVPGKTRAATIFLIQTAKSDPAIAECLAGADKYHAVGQGKKSQIQIAGAEFATLFVTTRPAPEPSDEHVYFYTRGFFGIGGDSTAVQTLIQQWPADPAKSLAADPVYQGTQKSVARASDLTWFVRPIESTELFEGPPKPPEKPVPGQPATKKKKVRSQAKILKEEGFTKMKGISGSIQFNTDSADFDFIAAVDAPLPYVRGMRSLHWKPGPKLALPDWVPAGVAEIVWINSDPVQQQKAYGNWFDQYEADGDIGTWDDIMKSLRDDPKGPKVDLEQDLWGKLSDSMIQLVDVNAKQSTQNSLGRRSLTISETRDADKVKTTLTKYFAVDKEVYKEAVPGGEMWFVKPGKAIFIARESDNSPQTSTIAVIGNLVVFSDDTDWLRELLTKKGAVSADKDPALAPLIARVTAGQTKDTSVRQVARFDESWRSSYEGLRSGNTAVSEETSVRVLKILLTGDASNKYNAYYKFLPPFTFSKQYLSPGGSSSDSFPSGIFSRGFILKPGAGSGPMKN